MYSEVTTVHGGFFAILVAMSTAIKKLERKVTTILSHYPRAYALLVGIGIVLFWRGVWHTADYLHTYVGYFSGSSIDLSSSPWWDGPLSFFVGAAVLYITGAFTSSFIGNELILSGLRGEKKLSERTEEDLKNEVTAISDIKDELGIITKKLEIFEKHAHDNHHKL